MCLEAKKQKGKNNWFLMQKCNNNVRMRSLLEAEINKSWRMRLKLWITKKGVRLMNFQAKLHQQM